MKLNLTNEFSICSKIRLEIRWRFNHMSNKVLKSQKASLYEFTQNYSNNIDNCIEFFKSMKWPDGFSCDCCVCHRYYLVKCVRKTKTSHVFECGSCHKQHSLLSDTIFQRCKHDLHKLLLGIFLFFNENRGISAIELCSILDVNYKTALLPESKCRILMSLSNFGSNSDKLLNSFFYEVDIFNIGAKSKNKAGRVSEWQPVLGILSTDKENNYPRFIKLRLSNDYTDLSLKKNIEKCCELQHDVLLNTNGE